MNIWYMRMTIMLINILNTYFFVFHKLLLLDNLKRNDTIDRNPFSSMLAHARFLEF